MDSRTYLDDPLLDVDETSFSHQSFDLGSNIHQLPKRIGRFVEVFKPGDHGAIRRERVVVRLEHRLVFLPFDPTTRVQVVVTLTQDLVRLLEATSQGAKMDKVELGGMSPFGLGVVDLELEIRRNPASIPSKPKASRR